MSRNDLVIRPYIGQTLQTSIESDLHAGRNFVNLARLVPLTTIAEHLEHLNGLSKLNSAEHLDQQFGQTYAKTIAYMNRNGLQCMVDGIGSRVSIGPALAVDDGMQPE